MITQDSWQRVQPVLDAALDLPPEEVSAWLERACEGDLALRSEIERLLHAIRRDREQPGFLDRPVDRIAGHELAPSAGSRLDANMYEPGQLLGPYRVIRRIGAGGMGVVYQARDTRLDREVALKLLPATHAADEDAARRFVEEARTASALDHPNIATIYDIGGAGGAGLYIAMAYCEGETLEARIARGPLAVDDARAIARQLAEGLAAAHARGIVHRDIKPANVIVTPAGVAKILDFGIATMAGGMPTVPGLTPGTLAYMSPEHTAGLAVDARSDVWALGVVLYEMLTGRRPFEQQRSEALISAIRNETPIPVATRRPDVPDALAQTVVRCLAKRPDERIASARDLLASLQPSPPPEMPAWRGRRLAGVAVAAVAAAWLAASLLSGNTNEDATQAYVRGRYWLAKSDPASFLRARDEFQRALDADPTQPLAWSGLSDALDHLAGAGLMSSREAYPRARLAAVRALDLDPTLAEAHVSLAMALASYYWDDEAAEHHFREAIRISTGYARAHRTYASHLRTHCRLAEAREHAALAEQLDPLDYFSHVETTFALYFGRRYRDAAAHAQRLADFGFADAYLMLALMRVQLGAYPEALAALDRVSAHPQTPIVRGLVYGLTGRHEDARRILATFDDAQPEAGFARAVVHLGLGDHDEALRALQHAVEARSWMVRVLKGEPVFDPLRDDPRFAQLLQQVGFADARPCV